MRILLKLFLFISLSFISSFVEASAENSSLSKQEREGRIYISSEDLLIEENCLYWIQGDVIIPFTVLFSDSQGLYTKAEFLWQSGKDVCFNGHPIMHSVCNGCGDWNCLYRCRCFEEPFAKPSRNE